MDDNLFFSSQESGFILDFCVANPFLIKYNEIYEIFTSSRELVIAQLAERLTVEVTRHQTVTGSIPVDENCFFFLESITT